MGAMTLARVETSHNGFMNFLISITFFISGHNDCNITSTMTFEHILRTHAYIVQSLDDITSKTKTHFSIYLYSKPDSYKKLPNEKT